MISSKVCSLHLRIEIAQQQKSRIINFNEHIRTCLSLQLNDIHNFHFILHKLKLQIKAFLLLQSKKFSALKHAMREKVTYTLSIKRMCVNTPLPRAETPWLKILPHCHNSETFELKIWEITWYRIRLFLPTHPTCLYFMWNSLIKVRFSEARNKEKNRTINSGIK